MNFYASHDYLDAAAEVFFPGRTAAIGDVAVGGEVLRLLMIDGRPVSQLPFLDYHQPVTAAPQYKARYVRQVARRIIALNGAWPDEDPNTILAPFVDWRGFAGFAAYKDHLAARAKGLIKDRERRARALAAQHGTLTFTADDCAKDVMEFARHWKSAQLQATGHPDYFADPRTLRFFEALRARNALTVSSLRAGGTLVSVWIGFIFETVWSGWVFTYDPAFRKFSAGHQLIAAMLEDSFARGHREFDFSEGAEDYKLLYATHARVLGDLGRPPLLRAAIRFAKSGLFGLSPSLLKAVQDFKRSIAQVSHDRV